jgi:hypothetical protein
LTGFNEEALTGATVKAGLRGKDLRQFQLAGRFRSAAVSAQLARAERGPPSLTVQSRDAGATLRFLDIYRRMSGGSLSFQISMGDGPQRGTVLMNAFALKNEPALRSIVSQQPRPPCRRIGPPTRSPQGRPERGGFQHLKAEFSRTASRLDSAMRPVRQSGRLHAWRLDRLRQEPHRHRRNLRAGLRPQQRIRAGAAVRADPRRRAERGPLRGDFPGRRVGHAPTLRSIRSRRAPGFLRKILGASGSGDEWRPSAGGRRVRAPGNPTVIATRRVSRAQQDVAFPPEGQLDHALRGEVAYAQHGALIRDRASLTLSRRFSPAGALRWSTHELGVFGRTR